MEVVRPPHPTFPQPSDRTVSVWRYLDLPKFIWLLENQRLFLPRVDLLKDPHEASITRATEDELKRDFSEHGAPGGSVVLAELRTEVRQNLYVSCWCLSASESEAMWRLYCPSGHGVALQTSYDLLDRSLPDPQMHIGRVTYLDYESGTIPSGNLFAPVMHKRLAFAHESEIRVVKSLFNARLRPQPPGPLGVTVDWDLNTVLQGIFVDPYSPAWFEEVVRAVVRKFTPNLESRIRWSRIKAAPIY